jgi:2-keto-4-pentenoate hydratase
MAMNDSDFDAARAALVAARRHAKAIVRYPAAWLPTDLAEAYRLQAAVIAGLGPVGAWKVAGVTPQQRQAMGVPAPVASSLPFVDDASVDPAALRLAAFIAPKIECEFAFELGIDLPSRGRPYSRDEVAEAVAAIRPSIEIVDSRLPAASGTLAELADGFNNGAFVAGPRVPGWRPLDLGAIGIVLTFTDAAAAPAEFARGSGRAILEGDPFGAVTMLANAQPPGRGLRAGDIVTTGSCTGAPFVTRPGLYRAAFDGLGTVALSLA